MTEKTKRELLADAGMKSRVDAIRAADRREADVYYARQLRADAANKVGDEAITDIVLPTIDRIVQGGVDLVDLAGHEGKGLVRVLRASSLPARLRKMRLDDSQIRAAVRFGKDFERARLGGLTANYEGGASSKRACEPERWCDAMDLLTRASSRLDADERVSVYGYVLFDVSAADLGAFLCGSLISRSEEHKAVEKYLLSKSLNKLSLFYEDWDFRAMSA